jgi:protocatechuate 3,4-dioxygenase beta subunit
VVTPAETEGPYFVDERLNRSDITTDPSGGAAGSGVPLTLIFNVARVNSTSCSTLGGAQVDVWHCDALGVYSDVSAENTVGQRYLRGYQVTDAQGMVRFQTIYPGWYSGRAVHIHFKIRTFSGSQKTYEFTSQVFLDDSVTDEVYKQAPYNSRSSRNTRNAPISPCS